MVGKPHRWSAHLRGRAGCNTPFGALAGPCRLQHAVHRSGRTSTSLGDRCIGAKATPTFCQIGGQRVPSPAEAQESLATIGQDVGMSALEVVPVDGDVFLCRGRDVNWIVLRE